MESSSCRDHAQIEVFPREYLSLRTRIRKKNITESVEIDLVQWNTRARDFFLAAPAEKNERESVQIAQPVVFRWPNESFFLMPALKNVTVIQALIDYARIRKNRQDPIN